MLGDEVNFDCWKSNPQITAWMAQHPDITDYAGLEAYYELQLLGLLKAQNTSYICWQEIFDNGVPILPDTVVDVWKGGWNDTLARVTKVTIFALFLRIQLVSLSLSLSNLCNSV